MHTVQTHEQTYGENFVCMCVCYSRVLARVECSVCVCMCECLRVCLWLSVVCLLWGRAVQKSLAVWCIRFQSEIVGVKLIAL